MEPKPQTDSQKSVPIDGLAMTAASGNELDNASDQTSSIAADSGDFALPGAIQRKSITPFVAGKYELLERIGEGGMGSVWKARQREPVNRLVALKLIKSGLDSAGVLARFDAERQALALMDHPNIAKIFDGGITETGSPYFVMEHVDGVSITRFCDEHRFTPKQRLELFIPVCHAIQHAHQKGIIHRDIKPSNVMVAMYDDRPIPKIIDFGVAKATGHALTDISINTAFGAIVGTPEYMSPEQANFDSHDIDTRSDVYALGVLLYELLAGSPPFRNAELKKAGLMEIMRVIREDDPPRPSTKISSAEALPSISANRSVEPRTLTGILKNELDWIVMKAIEKDRNRRYDSANDFAADVQRFIAGEAVFAHPPTLGYRLAKSLRRHRGMVFAASLVGLTLVAGLAGTTLGLFEARRQRDRANIERSKAVAESELKEAARQAEAEQRRKAEQANQQAFEALKSFTDDLMGKVLGGKEKLTDNESAILRNAQKQWEVFAESKGDTAEARLIRSDGASELANVQYRLGMNVDAEANDRKALEQISILAKEFPLEPLYRMKQGIRHVDLGNSLRANGNRAEAESNYSLAWKIFAQLTQEFPKETKYRQRLASSEVSLANAERARQDFSSAERHYRDALAIQTQLADEFPLSAGYRDDQVDSHWGIAYTMKRLERLDESETEYRLALDLLEKLSAEFPANAEFRHRRALLCQDLAVLLSDNGNDEAGAQILLDAVEVLVQLAAEYPSMPKYRSELSACRRNLGRVLGYLKKRTEAREQFLDAISLGERLVVDQPSSLPYQASLGLTYSYFADMLRDGTSPIDSMEWYQKAIRTLTSAYEQDRQVYLTKQSLYKCHHAYANAFRKLNRHAEAVMEWDLAIELAPQDKKASMRGLRAYSRFKTGQQVQAMAELTELTQTDPTDPYHNYTLACVYALASANDPSNKEEYARLAVEQLQHAVTTGFKDPEDFEADEDLSTILDREDFKKVLEEYKASLKPNA